MVQVPLNVSYRTTRVWGGTKDYHSALQGGHSTLNTVVLGEGISKSKYTTYFGHPLRTIPRLDLSEFANLAEFVVFSLGDQIHPKEIIAGP